MKYLKTFTESTAVQREDIKIIYRDENITIAVPLTFEATRILSKGTPWCTKSLKAYGFYSKYFILFRILFRKTGDKIRLTLGKNKEGNWTGDWGESDTKSGTNFAYQEIHLNGHNKNTINDIFLDNNFYSYSAEKQLFNKIQSLPQGARTAIENYINNKRRKKAETPNSYDRVDSLLFKIHQKDNNINIKDKELYKIIHKQINNYEFDLYQKSNHTQYEKIVSKTIKPILNYINNKYNIFFDEKVIINYLGNSC